MTPLDFKISYERNLPHIQPPGATLFVTFRLAGSIPAAVRRRLREEAARTEAALAEIDDEQVRARRVYEEQRRHFGRWDNALDAADAGPKWLQDERVAEEVWDSLHYRDEQVYDLDCFCIMPNHVHAVFTPLPAGEGKVVALARIMHSLKRYTARQANDILGREGSFWQHESYDHVVRDDEELDRIRSYVRDNPVAAGLVDDVSDWPWTYCSWL